MCRLKSGIILKNRVFVPEYDSHTEMLEELGIKDDYLNASKTFVRVELSPAHGDEFSDIDTWELIVDQDIIPEWYDEDTYKPRVVEAVKAWAKDHIHIGVDNLKISTGSNHYIKDCKDVEICGRAAVKNICGRAAVENIFDSAAVENIYGRAAVKNIYGSAKVENIYGSAKVENIYGSAAVENIFGSAKVENIFERTAVKNICDSAAVENIFDSAAVENIYGSAAVKNIYGSAAVNNIFGSAKVENIYGSAAVENIFGRAAVKNAKGFSTIISSHLGWNNKGALILTDNATFKDCRTKTIYQSGDWKLVNIKKGDINE